jgi:predicted Zn-dependent protease with MMP-like domain
MIPETVKGLLEAAEQALQDGRTEEAEGMIRKALGMDERHSEAQFLLGEVLREQGRMEECELAYRGAVLSNPSMAEGWSALSSVLFDLLRWEEARRAANRGLREDPWNAESAYVRAALRERRGDIAGARRDYLRAWRAEPHFFPLPCLLDDETLDEVVADALSQLHPTLQEYLSNVAILMEDVPSEDVLRSYDPPAAPTRTLGYFSGASPMERSIEDPWSNLPGAIVLFRRNLERMARSRDELIEELQITLYHEVGHFLGLDEEDLEFRGLD